PWSAKTVRASMGAVFRQPIARLSLEELSARLAGPLYGAALGEGSRDIRALDLGEASVAIGSEGQGLSRELMARCDGLLIIPMTPEAESLNAALAASIVMWEMRGRALPLRG
ncbi:MAG: TrmH family RNA methyltransferase, partial [bacterium]